MFRTRGLTVLSVCGAALLMSGCAGLTNSATSDQSPTTTGVSAEGSILWNDAVDHAGTTQRVCGPLAGMGRDDDDVFLNLGYDYPDPQRFTIVVWDVGDMGVIVPGTTVCASGEVTIYEGVAEIELSSTEQIELP